MTKQQDKTEAEQIKEIQEKLLAEELGEETIEEPKEEEKEEVTEPEQKEEIEEPKEKDQEEEKETKQEEKIDVEKIKEDIRREVSQETADKITKALGGDEATPEQKDKYQEFAEDFYKKNGRNPSWHELIPIIRQDAIDAIKQEEEERLKLEEQQREELKKQQEERTKAFNKYTDEQLNDLYASNKLPKIENPKDENDYGVKVRKALFKTMMEVNQGRVKEGKQPIYSIKEIFYEHFTMPKQQPAGDDAPISAGRGGAQPDSKEEYSYHDIQRKSFVDIISGK